MVSERERERDWERYRDSFRGKFGQKRTRDISVIYLTPQKLLFFNVENIFIILLLFLYNKIISNSLHIKL
jgi:hypothetical protein